MAKPNKHLVLFPFMAQGHYSPFISLASLLSHSHTSPPPPFTITLITTPLETPKLQSLLPSHPNLHLRPIPFTPSDHGLRSESTTTMSASQIGTLLQASLSLQPHFRQLILDITQEQGQPPACIVSDIFLSWTVQVAHDLGIFHTTFTTCGAYGSAIYFSLWLHLPHLLDRGNEFNLPGFPESLLLHRSQLPEIMVTKNNFRVEFYRKLFANLLSSDAVLCNTAGGLEPIGVELLKRSIPGRRVWSVGPLLLHPPPKTTEKAAQYYTEWLDSHPPSSVLYVSFGSQNTISASKMKQLAKGLESSRVPFIWVVRPPLGFDLEAEFREEWLPKGFEFRMEERKQGLVVKKWAPQVEILKHRGIGGFLSHCGWNSVLESLSNGVPIIGWPLGGEQSFNSKMLVEELGVCVEVARGVKGSEGSEEIERTIRVVMGGGEEGERLKMKAVDCARILKEAVGCEGSCGKGSSVKALEEFIKSISA